MPAGRQAALAFRAGGRRFAIEADRVAEVVRRPPVTRVPHAPPSLAGVAALRGRVLPVISLAELLGDGAAAGGQDRLIVLDGVAPIGLAVDEVIGLEAVDGGGLVETAEGAARTLPLDEMLERAFAEGFRRAGARRTPPPAEAAGDARSEQAASLLAFTLAGQAYALPLHHVREVIAVPADVAALPRADAAMLGVAHLRGALIPIVSTRVLLGLPAAAATAADRVVVASVAGARIGLAVDHVNAIVHAAPSAIGPVPKVLNRGAGEAQVTAMLRTPAGGLVSLLEPERLLAEESMAQILEDGRNAEATAETQADTGAGELRRFLIFQLGDERYGLDIASVAEVVALPERLTRVPRAPDYVLGVMSLRGQPAPVIDQRRRFGVDAAGAAARPRVIVTRIGELVAGFAVDAVTEIMEIPADRLAPTPELASDGARLFDRVAQAGDDGRVILLVNPRELLDRAERDLMGALAAAAEAT